ncbi:MAG: PAS domain-containing protein, partial [Nitrospinota bacterium]|nr:PAS domain-containing protein [Nitrospinota bacterium]
MYVSPAFEEIWGLKTQVYYDNPGVLKESIHPEDRERVLKALSKPALSQFDEEFRIIRSDGSLRWIRDRAFPIRNEDGEVYRIAGIAEDITE